MLRNPSTTTPVRGLVSGCQLCRPCALDGMGRHSGLISVFWVALAKEAALLPSAENRTPMVYAASRFACPVISVSTVLLPHLEQGHVNLFPHSG